MDGRSLTSTDFGNDDMIEYTLPSGTKTFYGLTNFLLLALNCILTFALYALLSFLRSIHIETRSHQGSDSLFGPISADFLLRREMIIVPILLLVVMFVKEFKNNPGENSVYLNWMVFAVICAHAVFIAVVPHLFPFT